MAEKLNGSVDLLAQAMRQVFSEAVEVAVEPVKESVDALRTEMRDMEGRIDKNMDRMEERLNARTDTTNENMQAQFAEQEKKIGQLLKGEDSA